MSTGGAETNEGSEEQREPAGRASVVCSSLFVLVLALAVIWPRPVLWINDLTFRADLSISHVSFLGREAPSWDVVYWAIVGFFVLALFHGRLDDASKSWGIVRAELSGVRSRSLALATEWTGVRAIVVALALVIVCLLTWLVADAPLMAQVSRVGSERVHDFVRLSNRLGGGGNPPLVIGYFVLAGLALRRPRWTLLGFAMAAAAGAGGLLAGALKPLLARSRPDLWLGPFSRVWGGESSFPSGHSIAAFAFAGAVFAGSRSKALRVVVLLAATSIAATRIIALRHWPSDVLFSILLGGVLGLVAGRVFVGTTRRDPRS